MDKFEKVQKIKEKTGVSYTEAVEALDRCNGDILDAIVYLERSGRTSERNTATFTSSVNKNDKESDNLAHATAEYDRNSEKDGIDTFVDGVKVLLRKSIDTSFVVERFNKKIVDVPVLVLIICFIFTFWIILPLLVVGLFFDCRYRFVGVGKVTVDVNKFCDRAADGATNIKVVEPIVYEFVVDPDEDVAFGTVELNEPVDAKSFDVTLTNIANATVELSDNTAFEINVTALTENGTITITPKTSVAGNFSATITLHDEDDAAADKVINVTMKVVAPKDCDRTDDFYTVGANNNYENRTSDEGWSAVNTAVVVNEEVTYWMINGKTSTKGVITSPEFNYGIKELSFDYYYSFNESNGISFKVEIKQNGSVVKTETITKADAVKNTIYTATIENINLEGKYQKPLLHRLSVEESDSYQGCFVLDTE